MKNYLLMASFTLSIASSLFAAYTGVGAANVQVLDAEIAKFQNPKAWPEIEIFLGAIDKVGPEVEKLNKESLGSASETLTNGAAKVKLVAQALAKLLDELRPIEKGDDNVKVAALAKLIDQAKTMLTTTKSAVDKTFLTEKRKQARDYLLAVIASLEKFQLTLQREAVFKNTKK